MIVKTAHFVGSFVTLSACPKPDKPEYAFIGRSNVGKSSLINMLTGYKKLAKISGTPGKTQTINHFLINDNWYLVDLPGYGYAKVSKTQRKKWEQFIRTYLLKRNNLGCVFVLIDCRIPPQKTDLEFINWLGEMHIAFILVFTKSDKLKPNQLANNIDAFKKAMKETWDEMPEYFISSAVSNKGKTEILDFIDTVNQQFAT